VPLDAIPAIAPQVSFQDGLLTIVAPNSTLGDILRSVRKHTSADIEIPPTANERVVTRLGPGPAREVLSELLNGSRFNYILLGSPQDANALVRVVLVAKAVETPAAGAAAAPPPEISNAASDAPEEPQDETVEEPVDQGAAEAEQAAGQQPEQPPVKTPQQMLQEMQQRQLQMQQQQQSGQAGQGVQPGPYPMPPGIPRPPQQQQPPDNQ
jgi:hypothetical protein